jgi:hypothetical protein
MTSDAPNDCATDNSAIGVDAMAINPGDIIAWLPLVLRINHLIESVAAS